MLAPAQPPRDAVTFLGTTEAPARFTVPAALDGVYWNHATAVPGTTVVLSVRAAHVGAGAPCVVEVAEQNGRVVWQGEGTITAGRFQCEVEIPAALNPSCRGLVGRVRLPEHGVEGATLLAVEPPAEVTGAAWDVAEAAPGQRVRLSAGVRNTREQAAVVEVFRQGSSGLLFPLGAPFAVVLEGGRMAASWPVPDEEGLALPPDAAGAAPEEAPSLFFRLRVGCTVADSPLLRVARPRTHAPR